MEQLKALHTFCGWGGDGVFHLSGGDDKCYSGRFIQQDNMSIFSEIHRKQVTGVSNIVVLAGGIRH